MDNHKNIYEYEVDGKKRYGDPFVIDYQYRKTLIDAGVDIDACHKTLFNPKSLIVPWYEALGKLSPGICAAFSVKQHNPETNEGMTLIQLYNLLTDFFRWSNEVKKNTEQSPNGSQSEESRPSIPTEESSESTESIGNSITEQVLTTTETEHSPQPPSETDYWP